MPINNSQKEEAEQLFVVDGLTNAEISTKLEISISTLKSWSTRFHWVEKRKENQNLNETLKLKLTKLKHKLADDALESGNPQTVYALAWLLRTPHVSDIEEKPENVPENVSEKTLTKIKAEIYGILDE